MIRTMLLPVVLLLLPLSLPAIAEEAATTDEDYIRRFEERFKGATPAAAVPEIASPKVFDERFLGEKLREHASKLSNDQGNIAWGTSYYMAALNDMFLATKEKEYLEANRELIRAVMAARDDRIGKQLWTGETAKAWGSDKYSKKGRCIFTVHTGVILTPILEFLRLARDSSDLKPSMGAEWDSLLTDSLEALAHHNKGYREGPAKGEGHYFGTDGEIAEDGKHLPANWQSAMGQAHWHAWRLTGDEAQKQRALALGAHIKNRLVKAPDGAYYWQYWMPEQPVTESTPREEVQGEDSSHAALTLSLPILLAEEGELFTPEDMERFGKTVLFGMGRLGKGVLFGDITGNPKSSPDYVSLPARWLNLARWTPEVKTRIVDFYLKHGSSHMGPQDIALLVRFGG